jgi:hypothetical protein
VRSFLIFFIFWNSVAQASISFVASGIQSSVEIEVPGDTVAPGNGTGYQVGFILGHTNANEFFTQELGVCFLNRSIKQSFASGTNPTNFSFKSLAVPVGLALGKSKLKFLIGIKPEILFSIASESTNYNTQTFQISTLGVNTYLGLRFIFGQKPKEALFLEAKYSKALLNQGADPGSVWKTSDIVAAMGYAF